MLCKPSCQQRSTSLSSSINMDDQEVAPPPPPPVDSEAIQALRIPIHRTSIVHLTLSGINSLLTLLMLCATLFVIIFKGNFPSLWYLSFLYTVLRILHICAGATAYTVKDVSNAQLKTRVSMACAVCGISVVFSLGEAIGRGFETNYYMKANNVLDGVGSGIHVLLDLVLFILSGILTVMCARLAGRLQRS